MVAQYQAVVAEQNSALSERSARLASQHDELFDVLPETLEESEEITQQRKVRQTRQQGFSASLVHERIEHTLTELEKADAEKTLFSKLKEELHYIPAQRPVHPFGKCSVTSELIAHIITDKYVYGMPLYRQEDKFKRLGQVI